MTITLVSATREYHSEWQVWIQSEGEGLSPLGSPNVCLIGSGDTAVQAWRNARQELGEALNQIDHTLTALENGRIVIRSEKTNGPVSDQLTEP